MKQFDTNQIHPEDTNNLFYWAKKWGVSTRQLNEAILYTGSLNVEEVKIYLKKDNWMYHPVKCLKAVVRTTADLIF